ncbi:MAG: TonB family protein, partial [Endomicrobium sp.]|nr:TonB family protein [Endomicrobium sp.]
MLLSKTVFSSFILSFGIHCAGIFALTMPAGKEAELLQDTCSYTEVEFINSQGECAVMNVEDAVSPQEEKKADFLIDKDEIALNSKKENKEESRNTVKEAVKEENEGQNFQNESSNVSPHEHGAGAADEKNLWRVVKCPMPAYPQQARKNMQEGEVIIEIKVLPSGEIESSKVVLSSGFTSIDAAALIASKRIVLKYDGSNRALSGVTLRVPYQ